MDHWESQIGFNPATSLPVVVQCWCRFRGGLCRSVRRLCWIWSGVVTLCGGWKVIRRLIRLRNQIGSDALADGFQETLWIDSDVGFNPDDIEKVRRHGLPIVCGIYPKKGKRELAIHILSGTPSLRFGVNGGLHELLFGGTGFLHVRRNVYETMIEKLSLPVCSQHANRPMWPFFQPLIRTAPARTADKTEPRKGHWYLAEDYAFCHRARLCGIPIIADTTIRLWHVGDYSYSWEDAGIDRQRFGDFDFQFS